MIRKAGRLSIIANIAVILSKFTAGVSRISDPSYPLAVHWSILPHRHVHTVRSGTEYSAGAWLCRSVLNNDDAWAGQKRLVIGITSNTPSPAIKSIC